MVLVYVLELEHGKYYIGKTRHLDKRMNTHFNYRGSEWTSKYKPIKILEIIPNCNILIEHEMTILYMIKYGIENVRGASYVRLKLGDDEILGINKIIWSATDKCYYCGGDGIIFLIEYK